jgi:phosphoribosylglycinamide formyltransferase 2
LSDRDGTAKAYEGVEYVLKNKLTDVRIFNKPSTRPYRRMAVVLTNGGLNSDVDAIKQKAIDLSKQIKISYR